MGVSSCGFKSHPRHQVTAFSRNAKRGDVAKWLRRRSAKPLFGGSNPPVASKIIRFYQDTPATDGWGVFVFDCLKLINA